jgi:hypothetical protein
MFDDFFRLIDICPASQVAACMPLPFARSRPMRVFLLTSKGWHRRSELRERHA